MNRKQKIIVSITGIVIVVLALLGLTYAYFVTQIQGNGSDKSIEVTTANLKLVYGDGNGLITATNIMPSNEIPAITKTFTVTNNGTGEASYVAVLQNVSYKKVSDNTVLTSFERQSDLRYTLICKQYNGETETGTCDGVTDTTFPTANNLVVMVSNKIPKDYVQKYTLTINYIDPNVDQSNDMDKGFSAKVNIMDIKMTNPYATLSGTTEVANNTLAYNIIHNAQINKNGTSLVNTPSTKVAEETTTKYYDGGEETEENYTPTTTNIFTYGDSYNFNQYTGRYDIVNKDGSALKSGTLSEKYEEMKGKYVVFIWGWSSAVNGTNLFSIYKVTNNTTATKIYYKQIKKSSTNYESAESSLSVTPDDYGTSYYYRGGVKDNYLNYSGMCWRIVRIEGDGSIKLVLSSPKGICNTTNLSDESSIISKGSIGNGTSAIFPDSNLNIFLNGGNINDLNAEIKNYPGLNKQKIKNDKWCLGDTTNAYDHSTGKLLTQEEKQTLLDNYPAQFDFEAGKRFFGITQEKNTTLKCVDGQVESEIGLINLDEFVFAGGIWDYESINYLTENVDEWWGLTLLEYNTNDSGAYEYPIFSENMRYDTLMNGTSVGTRPSLTLVSGTEISSGDGTIDHPYTVKM